MSDSDVEAVLAVKFARLLPHLNERQRRLAVAAEVAAVGRGGVSAVARASGLSRPTVYRGLAELDGPVLGSGLVRVSGGGRKRLVQTDPGLVEALEALIGPGSRGDPGSQLRWTTRSTRNLADALTAVGHQASRMRVSELLHELHYSLQGNAKVREGAQHPDRDAQFRYINRRVASYLRRHEPVISVDAKKKELIGNYKNPGRAWRPSGDPVEVNTHDFPDKVLGKAIPYGVYDVGRNHGWVEVGIDHDTAAFAVAAIRAWWYGDGAPAYPTRGQPDRRHHHPRGTRRTRRTRPRQLPARHRGHRPGTRRPPDTTPYVPRRVELHGTTTEAHNRQNVNLISGRALTHHPPQPPRSQPRDSRGDCAVAVDVRPLRTDAARADSVSGKAGRPSARS